MKQSHTLAEQYPAVVEAKEKLIKIKKELGVKKLKGRYPRAIATQIKVAKEELKDSKAKTKLEIKQQRVETFLAEFLKNGGDPTQAVKDAFGITNQSTALDLGRNMLEQSRLMGRALLEAKGITYGKLMDVAIDKMAGSKQTDWWDRIVKIGEYHDFMPSNKNQAPSVVNIIGIQKDLQKEFGLGDEEIIEGEAKEEDGNEEL